VLQDELILEALPQLGGARFISLYSFLRS
jgi:hypothetical protein